MKNGKPTRMTTGDLCEIAGLSPKSLDRWCNEELVTPHTKSTTSGQHRRWTVTQAVGFVVAKAVRNSPRGCALSYFGLIVEAFGRLSEDELAERLKTAPKFAGVIVTVEGGPQLNLEGERFPDRIDAADAYRHVKDRLAEFARRQRNASGRSRGAVGADVSR